MATPSSGFLDSLRHLGAGLLGAVHGRVELLAVELHEEKFRLVQIFVWISAAVFTGMMALTFASLALVYLFWDGARLAVLGGLAGFYLVALGVILAPLTRLAAVPLGLWLTRSMTRRGHLLGRLMRWGPALFSLVRGFGRTAPQ